MESKMRVIIVEDEEPASQELRFILEQTGKVEVIECISDGITAFNKICEINPDAVFMDIQIPGMNGMDVANKLNTIGIQSILIFVTAYDEHAIKAFEMNAVDYILKPYSEERIYRAIDRIVERLDINADIIDRINALLSSVTALKNVKHEFNKIPCEQYGRVIFVDESDIVFCFIENEQTYVKILNKKYLTNYTLHELENKGDFFRVHRSYLVNLNKIKELYPWFHGTYKIVMLDEDKTEIPVSRNNVKRLKDMLGI